MTVYSFTWIEIDHLVEGIDSSLNGRKRRRTGSISRPVKKQIMQPPELLVARTEIPLYMRPPTSKLDARVQSFLMMVESAAEDIYSAPAITSEDVESIIVPVPLGRLTKSTIVRVCDMIFCLYIQN